MGIIMRNVDIWKEALMYPMVEFLREKRLRWLGHVQRNDKDDATRKILQMEVDGKRNRGRPKLIRRDLVKDDMARNQMTKPDGRVPKTPKTCHDPSRHTTKCGGG